MLSVPDFDFLCVCVCLFLCVSLLVHVVADKKRLILSGQQLEDDRPLSDCGVKDKSVIYLFLWDAVALHICSTGSLSHGELSVHLYFIPSVMIIHSYLPAVPAISPHSS